MKKVTVFLAEDHMLIARGVRSSLSESKYIELVDVATNGYELLEGIKKIQPDILLLDLKMPSGVSHERFDVIRAIREIENSSPHTNIIILSSRLSVPVLEEAVSNNQRVRGYILKNDPESHDFVSVIDSVMRGGVYFSGEVRAELRQWKTHCEYPKLSERQIEILMQVSSDLNVSMDVHARELAVATQTLKNNLSDIYKVIRVSNLQSCLLKCLQLGYLPIEIVDFAPHEMEMIGTRYIYA